MKNLISNTEFGKVVESRLVLGDIDYKQYFILRSNFDSFVSQPLELWMFVPCVLKLSDELPVKKVDGVWVVLEEPKQVSPDNVKWEDYVKEYQQAKERCLFKGFNVKDGLSICEENSILHTFWNYDGTWMVSKGIKTIEDLSLYNLQLTKTAIKQIENG